MNKTLHILNGDSTAEILKQTSIEGDIVVWREMLCEGPICNEVGSDEFWLQRYRYFKNELGVPKLEYFDKTIKEIIKLEDVSLYDEIVLWFEYDLFCQVNLMAACTYLLESYSKSVNNYLVCTGREKNKEQLQTLADYPPESYPKLLEDRIKLSRNNLLFAKECWEMYVENDLKKLKEFNFNQQPKFAYFQLAMDQHLERFSKSNGLNQIQQKILEVIDENKLDKNGIVKKMLKWQRKETVYGFGDLQYFNYLDKLKEYYSINNEIYQLNEKGMSIK
ncbi:DUF1835 domain-containing protein [Aureibaculum sp. 2210JD6-5]|uniref:DUF1835 domain-containing protein n=1 Tax=Aureibaculum sp. 2210JD6-5 TaxID=3103957 RepID=UPI002AAC7F91|nr:DUF1835 domain-containing protein [Aureibaculum sp. 2210JD6-5]MDY7396211.1 DUF1835 domain-containing protein [Aureibaculum sp. 2210JD6-5]